MLLCLSSCSISYKMNGANINYQTTHSISIADFPNNAPMVNPTLSSAFTEALRDLYTRQTRLQVLRKNGDLEIEGEIVGYDLTQGAIKPDSYASESRLTVRITVHFTNNIYPEESFDRTYSAYQTFDASRLLSDVQAELCKKMRNYLRMSKKSSTFVADFEKSLTGVAGLTAKRSNSEAV